MTNEEHLGDSLLALQKLRAQTWGIAGLSRLALCPPPLSMTVFICVPVLICTLCLDPPWPWWWKWEVSSMKRTILPSPLPWLVLKQFFIFRIPLHYQQRQMQVWTGMNWSIKLCTEDISTYTGLNTCSQDQLCAQSPVGRCTVSAYAGLSTCSLSLSRISDSHKCHSS